VNIAGKRVIASTLLFPIYESLLPVYINVRGLRGENACKSVFLFLLDKWHRLLVLPIWWHLYELVQRPLLIPSSNQLILEETNLLTLTSPSSQNVSSLITSLFKPANLITVRFVKLTLFCAAFFIRHLNTDNSIAPSIFDKLDSSFDKLPLFFDLLIFLDFFLRIVDFTPSCWRKHQLIWTLFEGWIELIV